MRKTYRAKNSGNSAAEEPDGEAVWCDQCGEEKDWSEIDQDYRRADICYACTSTVGYEAAQEEEAEV